MPAYPTVDTMYPIFAPIFKGYFFGFMIHMSFVLPLFSFDKVWQLLTHNIIIYYLS